jgi:hypothetical protein
MALIGQLVDVRITEALPSSLRGEWIQAPQAEGFDAAAQVLPTAMSHNRSNVL